MSIHLQIKKHLQEVLKDNKVMPNYKCLKNELDIKSSQEPLSVLIGFLVLCHKLELCDSLDTAEAI